MFLLCVQTRRCPWFLEHVDFPNHRCSNLQHLLVYSFAAYQMFQNLKFIIRYYLLVNTTCFGGNCWEKKHDMILFTWSFCAVFRFNRIILLIFFDIQLNLSKIDFLIKHRGLFNFRYCWRMKNSFDCNCIQTTLSCWIAIDFIQTHVNILKYDSSSIPFTRIKRSTLNVYLHVFFV